jgi:hypothetical protein
MVETVPLVVCLGFDLHSRRGRDVSQAGCDISAFSVLLSCHTDLRVDCRNETQRRNSSRCRPISTCPPDAESVFCRCRCVPRLPPLLICTNHPSRRIHPPRPPLRRLREQQVPIPAYVRLPHISISLLSALYTVTIRHPPCLPSPILSTFMHGLTTSLRPPPSLTGPRPRFRRSPSPPRAPASSIASWELCRAADFPSFMHTLVRSCGLRANDTLPHSGVQARRRRSARYALRASLFGFSALLEFARRPLSWVRSRPLRPSGCACHGTSTCRPAPHVREGAQ